jgi:hypothetical protein
MWEKKGEAHVRGSIYCIAIGDRNMAVRCARLLPGQFPCVRVRLGHILQFHTKCRVISYPASRYPTLVQVEVVKLVVNSKLNRRTDNVRVRHGTALDDCLWQNVRLLGAYVSISTFSTDHHVHLSLRIYLAIQLCFRIQFRVRNIQTKDQERPGIPSAPSHPPIVRFPRSRPYHPSRANPRIQRAPER